MPAIKHILFPIDFSDRCCGAVPFVEAMASRYDAKITLLSVVQPYHYVGMGGPDAPPMIDTCEVLSQFKEQLANTLTKEFDHLRVDRVADIGEPGWRIADFAHNHDVDLIMMPTHGYGPFRRFLLGSITAKVLHDVACPVWTAAHVEEKSSRDHLACRNILCAVEAAPKSVLLMKWAAGLAGDLGANLRLVHVIPESGNSPKHDADVRDGAQQVIRGYQETAGTDVPLCISKGDVAEVIREEAERHEADLVVIGRGSIHETLGRLRAHSYAIIRQSVCPVLSV